MEGDTERIAYVSVSPEGTLIMCVLGGDLMQVWKKSDWMWRRTVLSGHTSWARCVAMGVNRTQDVSGSLNLTRSGDCIET